MLVKNKERLQVQKARPYQYLSAPRATVPLQLVATVECIPHPAPSGEPQLAQAAAD